MNPDTLIINGSCHIKRCHANDVSDLTWDNHGFAQLLLCSSGNIQINISNEVFNITKSNLFIRMPKDTISIKNYSDSFSGYVISIPISLIERSSVIRFPIWQIYNKLNQRMLFLLNKEDYDILISYINLLEIRAMQPDFQDSLDATHCLVTSLIIDTLKVIKRCTMFEESVPLSSASQLYGRFLSMLNSDNTQKRSVSYYADRLCISSKYLSSICKAVCGETANIIIKNKLIDECCSLLMNYDKSIKTIAFDLGFTTQSAFGKYFKTITGMSPSQFREYHSNLYYSSNQQAVRLGTST